MWYEIRNFLNTYSFYSDTKRVYCNNYRGKSSHLHVLCKVKVLRKFAKFTGKHQRWSLFFDEVVDGSLKPTTMLIKTFQHRWKIARFWRTAFYKTAEGGWFWLYQNINCHNVSVLELIINKSYKEAGRRGRWCKLLQRCTLVKELFKPCY